VFLLTRWVESVLICSFLFHVYFVEYYGVNFKQGYNAAHKAWIISSPVFSIATAPENGHLKEAIFTITGGLIV
jgi:hypothetical protein